MFWKHNYLQVTDVITSPCVSIPTNSWVSFTMLFNRLQYFCILLISFCGFCIGFKCYAKQNLNREFDILMFVQQWPITYCINWMNGGNDNECRMPPQKGIWTIHGIWPSRFSTRLNDQPACCDASLKFNVNSLQPIKDQLRLNWPSVRKDKQDEEFWEQEWLKHGSCGTVIDELNTANKYFYKALDWLQQYNMTAILAKADIVPDNVKSYTLIDINKAIKSVLNKNPSVNCYTDRTTNEQYLSEIRICFNKQLELIDCDGIESYKKDNVITNCFKKTINYRVDLPGHSSNWFTFFAYFGLIVLLVLIFVVVKYRQQIYSSIS